MGTKVKAFILLVVLVFLAYANVLTHGFAGDDHTLFGINDFYRNPNNLSKLFSPEFITRPEDFNAQKSLSRNLSVSGCVSYRPVTALSFFVDCFIWHLQPFGYHLTNIILHGVIAYLLYCLVFLLVKDSAVAVLAALFFALHPVQAELINNIGYRSDLICTLFYLLGFLFYVRWRAGEFKRVGLVHGCFFIALFTKETAVTFPAVILAYEYFFGREKSFNMILQKNKIFFSAQACLLLFYLFIYFFVFPNSSLAGVKHFSLVGQIRIALGAGYEYLLALILPWKVKILPSFYVPSLEGIRLSEILLLGILIAVCWGIFRKCVVQKKAAAFFVAWSFLTYLPTANLFPVPNPLAYRFLYLPSVGFFTFTAIILGWLLAKLDTKTKKKFYSFLLKVTAVGLLVGVTMPLNEYYQNDIAWNKKIIEDFPESTYNYLLLASFYRQSGKYDAAIAFLRKYLDNRRKSSSGFAEKEDYEILTEIGTCYVNNPDEAIKYFKHAIDLKPDYALAYAQMGKAYLLKGDAVKSLELSQRALFLKKDLLEGYAYAVEAALALGDRDSVKILLTRALKVYPQEQLFLGLKAQLEKKIH